MLFIAAAEIVYIVPSAHGSNFLDLIAMLLQKQSGGIESYFIKIFHGGAVITGPEDFLDVIW